MTRRKHFFSEEHKKSLVKMYVRYVSKIYDKPGKKKKKK